MGLLLNGIDLCRVRRGSPPLAPRPCSLTHENISVRSPVCLIAFLVFMKRETPLLSRFG